MIHIDVTFSLLTVRFLPWCHSIAFATFMVFLILKLHFLSLFLTWCHSVAFSTSMQLIAWSVAEIICARSVSDRLNSEHLQIIFSHLWILSLYIFFFALNDTYWCNIFSLDGAFSTLMSQYCICDLYGIFDLEIAFSKFIFDLMSQCCVFYFHAAFSNLMTFSSSRLHFLPWCHSFAFFTLIRRYSTLDEMLSCEVTMLWLRFWRVRR